MLRGQLLRGLFSGSSPGRTAPPAAGAGQLLFRVIAVDAVPLACIAGGQPEIASVPGPPAAVGPLTVALATEATPAAGAAGGARSARGSWSARGTWLARSARGTWLARPTGGAGPAWLARSTCGAGTA